MPPKVWTAERDDALARAYALIRPATPVGALGQMWVAIWQELNAMPGARIATPRAVRMRYLDVLSDSAVDSPDAVAGGVPAFLDVSSLNSPPALTAPAAPFAGVPAVVSYDYAKAWAEKYGLSRKRMGLDLRMVNAVRRRGGAAPFVLQGGADG